MAVMGLTGAVGQVVLRTSTTGLAPDSGGRILGLFFYTCLARRTLPRLDYRTDDLVGHQSLFVEHRIHHPAPARMWTRLPAMENDVLRIAARVHQRISQDRHPVESVFLVDDLSEIKHIRG